MDNLTLSCTLQRCNVDSSQKMLLEKCIQNDGSPCYYLKVKTAEATPGGDAWKKFDSFVAKKKKDT